MAITTDDIKIRASQRLTDFDDGGGYMTSTEIIDGSINNLFADISRMDRTYGRVSIRKFYMHVDTDDTLPYYGAHIILSELAKDPGIGVALFTTESDADVRTDAVNRLESYRTLGPRYIGWLWGDQPAGARQLLVFQPVGTEVPQVGSVLALFNDRGLATEYVQYVRITGVEAEEQTFSVGRRMILHIDVGDPLEVTFEGMEIHNQDNTPTSIYTTIVSDAASYYGSMKLSAAIGEGDTTIMVDSIYTQLVPTSQSGTSLTNLAPGEVGPIKPCGQKCTFSLTGLDGTVLHLGQAVVPGTVELTIANTVYTDRGDGVLMQGSNQAGTLNYSTGQITFSASRNGTVLVSFDPGVAMSLTPTTLMIPIMPEARGYNYVAILWPPPAPGSLSVDYMAEGQWYRLRDDGLGYLVPDIDGTGTGRIDYSSGQLAITCGALPDVETPILVRWGNQTEIIDLAGNVDIDVDPVAHTIAESPGEPGSFSITWPVGVDGTATATDDGSGNIVGDASGWICYGSGKMFFTPSQLPVAGSSYDISYQQYAKQTHTANSLNFTLPSAPKPRTLAIQVPVSVGGFNHTYVLRDVGNGVLRAPGWTATEKQCRASLEDSHSYNSGKDASVAGGVSGSDNDTTFAMDQTEETIAIKVGGISGTVDYVTGNVTIDLSTADAIKSTILARAQSKTQAASSFDIKWGN